MFSAQRLSARFLASRIVRSRCDACTQATGRRAQLLVAAADKQAGGGRGGTVMEPVREKVTFLQPDGNTLCIEQLTQDDLDWVLEACGARGFVTADGTISGALGRLPEGGTVRLSYAYTVRRCGLVVGGVARLPSVLLFCGAMRPVRGVLGAINTGGWRPASLHPPPLLWLRCLQWVDEMVSQAPTKQEMAPLRDFVRSTAAAENGEPVLQLQSTPFTYAGGDVRLWGCSCLEFAITALVGPADCGGGCHWCHGCLFRLPSPAATQHGRCPAGSVQVTRAARVPTPPPGPHPHNHNHTHTYTCLFRPPGPAQEYMRMEIAFVAGGTLYVGHYQRELDEMGVFDMCSTRRGLLG